MSEPIRFRVAVVDDEPLARAAIRSALATHPEVTLVGEAADGLEAVRLLREESVDAVFLDVRMPGLDGFEVLESLGPGRRPAVVFITAFDDHAVRAFDVHAVDYLVKPFDDARFDSMIARLGERIAERRRGRLADRLDTLLASRNRPAEDSVSGPDPTEPHTRIQVREGPHIRFVDAADVRWIETDGNHVVLHLTEGSARIRHTLKDLLAVLDSRRFVRIHRTTALNLDHLLEVQPWFSGDYVALMRGGGELRVSRTYRDRLLRTSF